MLQFNFTPFPTLSTERLVLRSHTSSDLQDLYRMRTNDAVTKYLDRPKQSFEETAELLQKIMNGILNNEAISWVICRKDDPSMMGSIAFWRTIPEHHRAEIGYMLLPEHWGGGLMSEALTAVLRYGFHQMNLHSVEANVNPENLASARLLEKAGFRQEAYFKENYFFDGQFLDSAIFSLLKADFLHKHQLSSPH